MKGRVPTRCGQVPFKLTAQDAGVRGSPSLCMGYSSVGGVDLVLHLLAARTCPADTVRVGVATRTPLRWFAAPALVQGSTGRQTPGGL